MRAFVKLSAEKIVSDVRAEIRESYGDAGADYAVAIASSILLGLFGVEGASEARRAEDCANALGLDKAEKIDARVSGELARRISDLRPNRRGPDGSLRASIKGTARVGLRGLRQLMTGRLDKEPDLPVEEG